jgi:hypothetical protein
MDIVEQGIYEARLTNDDTLCYYEQYQIYDNKEEYIVKSKMVNVNCFQCEQDAMLVLDKNWDPIKLVINVLNDTPFSEFNYKKNEINSTITDADGIVSNINYLVNLKHYILLLSGAMLIPFLSFRKEELLNLSNEIPVQIIPDGIGKIKRVDAKNDLVRFTLDFQVYSNNRFTDKIEFTCNQSGRVLMFTTTTKNLTIKLIDKNE